MNSDWIPCKERLPDKTGKYLVTTANGATYWDRFYADDQTWGHETSGRRYKGKHKAWMELPEPYCEGGCSNCAYAEYEEPRTKQGMYCTNLESERCFDWVTPDESCPNWVKLTSYTQYLNSITDREGCGKA